MRPILRPSISRSLSFNFVLVACLQIATVAAWLALSLMPPGSAAQAQSYPSRPIRVVVPYPPGGNADIIARLFGERLNGLGAPTIIDNRGGGGGAIGLEYAAHAAPDGYTIVHATNNEMTVVPAVRTALAYDPIKDFIPISTTSKFPFVLVVRKDLPVKTLDDLVALAKAQPGRLTFGSVGIGTANHLILEPFKARFNIDVLHVPYKGAAPILGDLLGGHLDASFTTVSSILPQVQNGDLRALLVAGKSRIPQLPDVPSAGELGLNDVVAENWTAFLAPAGTDPAIVAKLHDAIDAAGRDPAMASAIEKAGAQVATSTPSAAAALIKTDLERWRAIAKDKGIKVD